MLYDEDWQTLFHFTNCYYLFGTKYIVLNRIAHAFPAWGPFLNTALSQRINGFFKRSYRYGFTNHVFEVQELLNSAMRDLFTKIQSPEHCLYPLLPPERGRSNRHRPTGHDYELPNCTYNFHKQSYVINCLFRFFVLILYCMYPHCTMRIRLLYAFNKYFDFVLQYCLWLLMNEICVLGLHGFYNM